MNTETTPAPKEVPQPASGDKRAKFEAWATAPERQLPIERHPLGQRTYADPRTAWAWSAWQDSPLAASGAPQEPPGDAPSDGWQPIETAPKDGTRILLWIVHENAQWAKDAVAEGWAGPCVGAWLDFNGGGWSWSGLFGNPTRWTPLPTHPAAMKGPQ